MTMLKTAAKVSGIFVAAVISATVMTFITQAVLMLYEPAMTAEMAFIRAWWGSSSFVIGWLVGKFL